MRLWKIRRRQMLGIKALLYFRLLRRDVNVAQRVISGRDPCSIQGAFAEDNCAVMDRLVDEAFNTFAVVYGETPDQFVDRAHRARDKPTDEDVTSETPLVSNDAPPAAPVEDSFDLLGSEDVAPPAPPSRALVRVCGLGHGRPVSSQVGGHLRPGRAHVARGARDAGRRSGGCDARFIKCAHDGVGSSRGGAQVLRLRAGFPGGVIFGPGRHLHGVNGDAADDEDGGRGRRVVLRRRRRGGAAGV